MPQMPAPEQDRAEWALPIRYAPPAQREALRALLRLDDRLGSVVRTTSEPALGQMRLLWWHDALGALDRAPPPAEPVLAAVHAHVVAAGVPGALLQRMVEGYERLIEADAIDAETLAGHADARGAAFFTAAAAALGDMGATERVARAGRGWALADLSRNLRDPAEADAARSAARAALSGAFADPWPVPLRALGAMALMARFDVADAYAGPARRVARLLWHRMTGR